MNHMTCKIIDMKSGGIGSFFCAYSRRISFASFVRVAHITIITMRMRVIMITRQMET